MPNFVAIVGIDVRSLKISADDAEQARKKVEAELEEDETIFDLTQSSGSGETG